MRTIDDMKLARDGHLGFGPMAPKDYPRMRRVFEHLRYCYDRAGNVIGELTTDGGIGAIQYGREDETSRG